MTAHKVVTDDTLGKIATRQWELYRRVKDGSLDPNKALSALQGIIENETDLLDIEQMDWKVSSQVYEIAVEEGDDFPAQVAKLGYLWWHNDNLPVTILSHRKKQEERKVCLRLAVLTRHPSSVGAIRVFADRSGFDLATSWELLAFVRKAPTMRVVSGDLILAAGDLAQWEYQDKTFYGHIVVSGGFRDEDRAYRDPVWAFDNWGGGLGIVEKAEDLHLAKVSNGYHVLLRERNR